MYKRYYDELKNAEEEAKIRNAEAKFGLKAGIDQFNPLLLKKVCFGLGSYLFDFVDEQRELTENQKKEVAIKIKNILQDDVNECKKLLSNLDLFDYVYQNICVPLNSKRFACVPSSMNSQAQINGDSEGKCLNHVYPFPFGISTHFPVFFCHSVFADFMDILNERNSENPVVVEYRLFMEGSSEQDKLELARNLVGVISTDEKGP